MQKLIAEIPRQEVDREEAKDRKWVDYGVLCQVPSKIREQRKATRDTNREALLCRDELIITWLLVLPWRIRNLRECKLGLQVEGGNLFKCQLHPTLAASKKSHWVEEALREDSNQKFWQFYFRPEQTKTGHKVQGILPKQLIPLLEEYVQSYRPLLVQHVADPGTLFLSENGKPLSRERIRIIVCNLTKRFTGKSVNPHLFRDIFAVKWLQTHPEEYLSLSKILWHHNIQTTLQIYGSKFDEAQGARRAEEWLDEINKTPNNGAAETPGN